MKILYVATISNTINAFLIPHIKILIEQGHQVDVAFRVEQELKPEIKEMGCKIHIIPFQRSPISKDNFKAYKVLKQIIMSEEYELIHTHTPVASAIVRLVCKNMKNVRVYYTAHGFHFFRGAPLINWIFYYPIERYLAKYTDVLITINKEDYNRGKNFKARKVEYIPGVGIDVNKFNDIEVNKKLKRKELSLPEDSFVALSVGELNKNKNHEVVIRAIAKMNNPHIHYVICGQGVLESYLRNLAKELGLESQVHLLGFRKDIAEICKISDVFVFPSKREGLGLAAIEAMAVGLPIITSNLHGILDYSIDGITGYTCNPKDVNGFVNALDKLREDKELCIFFGKSNIDVARKYDLDVVNEKMKRIYGGISLETNTNKNDFGEVS